MSDEEDAQILKHEIALEKAKCRKEEWQRQWEEEVQWAEEAEKAWREVEAKKAQRDAEAKEAWKTAEVEETRQKAEEEEAMWKAEALVAWHKQLELLLQQKVAAWITWEEEVWRALETGREAMQSGITGYGKGKVPEKRICTNCLRKGIECKWDKGGQGKSESYYYFLTPTQKMVIV